MARDVDQDRPFGVGGGQMLPSPEPSQATPPAPPFTPEPPPWQHALEHGDLDPATLAPLDPPAEKMDALGEMKARAEPEFDPPAPAGPPLQMQPLANVRPRPPEPDWREEEALRDGNGELVFHELPKDEP